MEKVKQTIYKIILVALILGMIALLIVFNIYKHEKEDRDLNYNVISKHNTAVLIREIENTIIENDIVENNIAENMIVENVVSESENDVKIENVIAIENTINVENIKLPETKNKEEIQKDVSNLYQTIEEYISVIYNNFQGGIPLPEFDNIKEIDDYYLNVVAYLNDDILQFEGPNEEKFDYTYEELNNLIVALFGEEANNVLFSKGEAYPYESENERWNPIGMGFAEGLTYDFIIDKIEKIDDKTSEVYIIEYSLDRGPQVLLYNIEFDGVKEVLKNNKDEIVDEFTYKAEYKGEGNYESIYSIPNDEVVVSKLSKDGLEVTEEYVEEYIKNNVDKFGLTKLVIEQNEELDLFYLKSCERVKK